MIQETHSCKSSMILTSHGQNSKKHCVEILHENDAPSVTFALYVGLPKSPCELFSTRNLSYKNVMNKYICIRWVSTWMGGWMDRCFIFLFQYSLQVQDQKESEINLDYIYKGWFRIQCMVDRKGFFLSLKPLFSLV